MIDEREPSVPGQRVEDAKALAELRLADDEGQVHRLGDTWAVRPVVLAFLRHFG